MIVCHFGVRGRTRDNALVWVTSGIHAIPNADVEFPEMTRTIARRRASAAKAAVAFPLVLLAACSTSSATGASGATPRIPASVQVLTVTYKPGTGSPPDPSHPADVTITALAAVRQIATLIDGLKPLPKDNTSSCPAQVGGRIDLAFRKSPAGAVVAEAVFNASGCGGTTFTLDGVRQPPLQSPYAFVQRVLKIVGIRGTYSSR
jgi:hypothetical protein